MQKREIVKAGASLVVTAGIGLLARPVIESLVSNQTGKIRTTVARIGAVAVLSLISARTTNYIDEYVDSMAEMIDNVRESRQREQGLKIVAGAEQLLKEEGDDPEED